MICRLIELKYAENRKVSKNRFQLKRANIKNQCPLHLTINQKVIKLLLSNFFKTLFEVFGMLEQPVYISAFFDFSAVEG